MKTNWQTKKFEDCLNKVVYTNKIQRKVFLKSGIFPIISQELEYINGYWNNEKDLFKCKKPVVIFGDHTLVLKYVDFDFVLGADGVKILQPREILDSRFFYFSLQSVDLKSLGYARHYRLLKEIDVSFPPLPEQRRIVKIIDEVFENVAKAKENAEKNFQNTKDLFESYLQGIFTNPGKDWENKKLDEICEMINRGVSPKYIESKGLCVLNQKCIRDHKINFDLARLHDVKNKKVALDKYIKIGDVLVNSTGTGTLGRVAQVRELNIEATVDSHVTIVRPIKNLFYSEFFGYGLIFIEKEITKRGDGCGGQIELARNTLKNDFRICFPKSLTEQKSIVAKLDALSAETKKLEDLYKHKLADLEELKKSILKKTFEGRL